MGWILTIHPVKPAFIPVHARRSFANNTVSSATPPAAQSQPSVSPASPSTPAPRRKPVEWPQPLRLYVQRSFFPENQITSVSRGELEAKLKSVITDAAQNDQLDVINWDSLPLPQVMVQNERNSVLTSSTAPEWNVSFATAPDKFASTEEISRKRKSMEMESDIHSSPPPWRQANKTPFETRVTYPTDKRQRMDHKNLSKSKANLEMRKKRFETSNGHTSPSPARSRSPVPRGDEGPIVGRCQDLEKNYFRLTSAPNPDSVRPLPVLQKTLDLLKRKWKRDNNYGYICDQFKSLRQDLTVQHIRTAFTVSVYEIHARIALEKGDLGEYNQCQTQLRALYAQQLGGNPMEFKAYRILYFIYTRNWSAMNDTLSDLTAADKQDPAVKHALDVRSAVALGNYHRFFQLYLDTPNMGAYLMDMFVDRERLSALAVICKS